MPRARNRFHCAAQPVSLAPQSRNNAGKWQQWWRYTQAVAVTGFDRITIDSKLMNGQPCIRGMRLTVRRVLDIIASYPERAELFREYPELEEEDLQQALRFAAANLDDQAFEIRVA